VPFFPSRSGHSGSVPLPQLAINCLCPAGTAIRRIERDNLFEQICALLSKTAFPVNGPLSAVHLQSLDGILAILSSLASQ
jgi:hypothetical protein